jgi:ribA/ribD-fused uncharacterized protein
MKRTKSDLTWQEAQIKKSNLVFSGVSEINDGMPGGCINSLRNVIENELGMAMEEINMLACYRLGAPNKSLTPQMKPRGPRPILVKLNTIADRNKIWENKTKLKGKKTFISEDLPKATEKRRAQMYPILKRAKKMEKYKKGAYMLGDKLVIEQRKYTVDTIRELPDDLNPWETATETIDNLTFFFTKFSTFSNHYCGAPFRIGRFTYRCTEQRYFSEKAKYLGDEYRYDQIMAEKDPAIMLAHGKKIENITGKDWSDVDYDKMLQANREKFQQNTNALIELLETGTNRLAECSTNKWGIGYAMDDVNKTMTTNWGTNLMGQILELLRLELRPMGPTGDMQPGQQMTH